MSQYRERPECKTSKHSAPVWGLYTNWTRCKSHDRIWGQRNSAKVTLHSGKIDTLPHLHTCTLGHCRWQCHSEPHWKGQMQELGNWSILCKCNEFEICPNDKFAEIFQCFVLLYWILFNVLSILVQRQYHKHFHFWACDKYHVCSKHDDPPLCDHLSVSRGRRLEKPRMDVTPLFRPLLLRRLWWPVMFDPVTPNGTPRPVMTQAPPRQAASAIGKSLVVLIFW